MPRHVCCQCGREFYHRKSIRKLCGNACRYAAQAVNPNSGRFIAGSNPHNHVPVGTVRVRQRRQRVEGPRVWVKVAEPNVWKMRAVAVWEQANGLVPAGMVVHHRNRDTLDDRLENLDVVSRAMHLAEHRPEFEEKRARLATAARHGE